MARKIKFPLEMADGYKVHNGIDELREHFDIDSVLKQFFSGKLERWLRDRYYEKEADNIATLNKEADDLSNQLCIALGIEADEVNNVDTVALKRLNEKESFLRQKTDDKQILANARITALTQADLADLLDLDEPVIYLCGETFSIPINVPHKKYRGVLGTPKIDIQANSDVDLQKHDILLENVEKPWNKALQHSQPVLDINSGTVLPEIFKEQTNSNSWDNTYNPNEPYIHQIHPVISGLLDNGYSNYDFQQLVDSFNHGSNEAVQQAIHIGIAYTEFLPLGIWEDSSRDTAEFVIDLIKQYLKSEKSR